MTHEGQRTVAAFYDRWANLYTSLAKHAPGVGRLRRLTVDELALEPGDTVVDMGSGPGVNFEYLRAGVGQSGQVIGVDVAPEMLGRARRIDPQAELLLGDASRPPIQGEVDAVLATFVVTLFDDPERVIDRWWSMLAPGGRLAVLNLGPMRGLAGSVGNPFLNLGLRLSTPTASDYDEELITLLDERVKTAHEAIAKRAARVSYYDSADGLFRVATGLKAHQDQS